MPSDTAWTDPDNGPGVSETVMTGKTVIPPRPSEANANVAWDALAPEEVVSRLKVDPSLGLGAAEAQRRLEQYGPNALARLSRNRSGSISSSTAMTTCRSSGWSPQSSASSSVSTPRS